MGIDDARKIDAEFEKTKKYTFEQAVLDISKHFNCECIEESNVKIIESFSGKGYGQYNGNVSKVSKKKIIKEMKKLIKNKRRFDVWFK